MGLKVLWRASNAIKTYPNQCPDQTRVCAFRTSADIYPPYKVHVYVLSIGFTWCIK